MKNIVIKSVLFLLLTLIALYGVQLAIDRIYIHRSADKFTSLFRHQLDADIMVFGPSTALRDVSPPAIQRTTGRSCYNMGFDGMFYLQEYPLIKEFSEYSTNCKMVVLTCNIHLDKDKVVFMPEYFYAFLGNSNVYRSLYNIEPRKFFMARYLPGYKMTLLGSPFYSHILNNKPPADTNLGYIPIPDDMPKAKEDLATALTEPYDEEVTDSLKSIVTLLAGKNRKVVIVMCPIYQDGYKQVQNINAIKSKFSKLTGRNIYFLDYSTDSSFCQNRDLFYDYAHLNTPGSVKFSTTLAAGLQKILQQ